MVGGYGNSGTSISSAERYNPGTDSWTAAGTLANARVRHAATLLASGQVLVTGGQGVLSSAELYDRTANAWSPVQPMLAPRQSHSATRLPTGLVLVAGGDQGTLALNSVELYDPISNIWSDAGTLVTARENHTANLLPSGQVLVAAGAPGQTINAALDSAELYIDDASLPTVSTTLQRPIRRAREAEMRGGSQMTGVAEISHRAAQRHDGVPEANQNRRF